MQIAMDFFFCRSFLSFYRKKLRQKFYATGPVCVLISAPVGSLILAMIKNGEVVGGW